MREKPLQVWTPSFIVNMAVNLFVYLGYYALTVIMVAHAIHALDTTPSEAGLVVGIFMIAGLSARIFAGSMMERVGYRKILLGGIGLYLLATILYHFAGSLIFITAVRVIHGMGWGFATTATATIVAYIVPAEKRGEGIGYYSMSVTLASAIGPFIGMNLYEALGFDALLVACTIMISVSLLSSFLLRVPQPITLQELPSKSSPFRLSDIFEVSVIPLALIGLITFFTYASVLGFISTYAASIDLERAGSIFFIVYSVAMLLSRPITGRLFDEKGEGYVIYPAFLLFAAGFLVMSQAHNSTMLLLSAILMGVGFGTFTLSGQAIALRIAPAHRLGLATSTFLAIAEIGIGIGPFFQGFIIDFLGFRGFYAGMAVIVLLAMSIFYMIYGRKRKAESLAGDI